MVIYLLVVSICIALISRVFWQHNICIFNILEFNTVISENAFSWHPKSEKWFCQGLVHTVPKDSCPSGTRPMEMYELVLGKTHFSDFGCQEKIHFFFCFLNLSTPIADHSHIFTTFLKILTPSHFTMFYQIPYSSVSLFHIPLLTISQGHSFQ